MNKYKDMSDEQIEQAFKEIEFDMKHTPYKYANPLELEDLADLLEEHGVRVLKKADEARGLARKIRRYA